MKSFNQSTLEAFYQSVKRRKIKQSFDLYPQVAAIIQAVAEEGDQAIRRYALQFDGVAPETLRVPAQALEAAYRYYEKEDPLYIEALEEAKFNISEFHRPQRQQGYSMDGPGFKMGQRVLPLERVGIYVPGGEAAYPSTLLMNAIPAQIAGVSEIVVVSPPQKDFEKLRPLYAAAYLLGIQEFYLVGGVQAIAALTYGTPTIAPVDKITGPGNQYVAAAKKLVYGEVAIDMIAGPSEVAIISDGSQPLDYVAADMLSQLEHDGAAMAVLLTTCEAEAAALPRALEAQLAQLSRQDLAAAAYAQNTYVVVLPSLEACVQVSNAIAPEHLELLVREPFALLEQVTHAGAVFLGAFSPEPLGDYLAGPNHTLPTTGSARYASPLGTYDFQKRLNYLYYDREALMAQRARILKFSEKERLEAHGRAIAVRL